MAAPLQRNELTGVAIMVDPQIKIALDHAVRLAQELDLPLLHTAEQVPTSRMLYLHITERGLELRSGTRLFAGAIYVDFARGTWARRRRTSLSKRQLIARAIGLGKHPPSVLDATAGLARDAFQLACLGCTVTAFERSGVLGALVADGLRRARGDGDDDLRQIVARIKHLVDDSRTVLRHLRGNEVFDVVYLDPMFPQARRSLPKKELQACRLLVGDDDDSAELFSLARECARRRVVVKRHPHSSPMGPKPDIQYRGKQVRYDVYLCDP